MTSHTDSTSVFNRHRRRFMQAAGLGGAGLLMPRPLMAAAMAAKPAMNAQQMGLAAVTQMTFKPASEQDLDIIAGIDPALHAIAADILAHAKYTMTSVAANAATSGANELADTCRSYIATRKPASRAAYLAKSTAMLAAPVEKRNAAFGRYAALTPAVFVASDQARLKTTTLKPMMMMAKPGNVLDSLAKLSTLAAFGDDEPDPEEAAKEAQAEKDAKAKAEHDKDVEEGHKFKTLEFFINHVKCIDNTGGVFEGTDEIAMGGAAVGATGHIRKIPQFHVQDGFDVGVVHTYPGGLSFAQFEVPTEKPWPHEFLVTVAMAELDSGGFGDFLEKVWNKVSFLVTGAIADAAGAGIAAAIGSVIPGLGTLIGAVIGAFIGWLVGLFHNDDDVVGSKTKKLGLHHSTKSYYDKKKLTTHEGIPVTIDLRDAGHYQVVGGWRLVHP